MRLFLLTLTFALVSTTLASPPAPEWMHRDILINADIWEEEPRIMGAGLGFTNILGIPGIGIPTWGEWIVRFVGGTWNTVEDDGDGVPLRAQTSAASLFSLWLGYGTTALASDGFPVEFSWPVQPSTVDASDFLVTLSDGSTVTPAAASIFPNFEFNERSTVVLVGQFGDRRDPSVNPNAVYVVKLEIVEDETPLHLVGVGGKLRSAVGFTFGDGETPMTPYLNGSGPKLCAAKLSRLNIQGENGPPAFQGSLPNHGKAIWGPTAKYRLRMLTTGGFSQDGVSAMLPSDFATFFKLRAVDKNGEEVWITEAGKVYHIDGYHLQVLGLADLGLKESLDQWNLAYAEDHDNQIDIIMRGDEEAMRRITDVVIPASGTYIPFFNPGGPGNAPTPGVTYTQPGPEWWQPVTIAIDDPMTVTWFGEGDGK